MVRAGIAVIVDAEADFVVVGEAGDGAEAVTLVGRLTPDVVLMDIRMPGRTALRTDHRTQIPSQDLQL